MLTTEGKQPESAIAKFPRGQRKRSIFLSFLQGAEAWNCLDCLGTSDRGCGVGADSSPRCAQDCNTEMLQQSDRWDGPLLPCCPAFPRKCFVLRAIDSPWLWRPGSESSDMGSSLCQAIPSGLCTSCRRNLIKLVVGALLRKCPPSLKSGWSVNRNSQQERFLTKIFGNQTLSWTYSCIIHVMRSANHMSKWTASDTKVC